MASYVQNSETGEMFYMTTDNVGPQIDEETGEPLSDKIKVRYMKHKHFQIPKQYLRGTRFEEFEKVMLNEGSTGEYRPAGAITVTPISKDKETTSSMPTGYKREDYMNMEGVHNDIILGYNKMGYLLYLVPSLFFFNVYLGFVVLVMEVLLHAWAHHKNNLNMSRSHFYRSPLHVLTSQYCAQCRAESDDDLRVFSMLNKQMRNAQTIKDLTKAIS